MELNHDVMVRRDMACIVLTYHNAIKIIYIISHCFAYGLAPTGRWFLIYYVVFSNLTWYITILRLVCNLGPLYWLKAPPNGRDIQRQL